MPHTLTADSGLGHFYAASVTDDTLVADLFILSAVALPVLAGSKDPLAEQSVLFRFQRPVIDGLGLGHLASGPLHDFFR